MTLSDKLHLTRFYGFAEFELGDILYSFSEFLRISRPKRSLLPVLKLAFKTVVSVDSFAYSGKRSNKLLAFVAAEANQRSDIRGIRKGMLCLGVSMDTLDATKKSSLSFLEFTRSTYALVVWWFQLGRCGVGVNERVLTMDRMLSLWHLKRFCENNINLASYELLTVFYDAEPHHHLLVRMAQKLGVHTATLQHGIILAPRKGALNNIDFAGIEFLGSCADTFLAWNDFTVREGIRAGISANRFRIVGSSKQLSNNNTGAWHCPNSGVFGVLLDGEYTKVNNPTLIRIAAEYAAANGKKFEVRYHPRFRGNEYDEIIPKILANPVQHGDQIEDYFSRLDFVVGTNSTAILDAISFGIPVYLQSTGAVTDKYRDVECPKFDSSQSLEEIIILDKVATIQDSLRKSLTTVDVKDGTYKSFLTST